MTETVRKKSFIPWLFVLAFLFVLAANGAMITVALDTFPGFAPSYEAERNKANGND